MFSSFINMRVCGISMASLIFHLFFHLNRYLRSSIVQMRGVQCIVYLGLAYSYSSCIYYYSDMISVIVLSTSLLTSALITVYQGVFYSFFLPQSYLRIPPYDNNADTRIFKVRFIGYFSKIQLVLVKSWTLESLSLSPNYSLHQDCCTVCLARLVPPPTPLPTPTI